MDRVAADAPMIDAETAEDSAAPTKFYYQRQPVGTGYRIRRFGYFSAKALSDGPRELRVKYVGKQDSVYADYAIPFWVY